MPATTQPPAAAAVFSKSMFGDELAPLLDMLYACQLRLRPDMPRPCGTSMYEATMLVDAYWDLEVREGLCTHPRLIQAIVPGLALPIRYRVFDVRELLKAARKREGAPVMI